MAKGYYIENGSVHEIKIINVYAEDAWHFVKKGWVGVDGVARLVYGKKYVVIPRLVGEYTFTGNAQVVTIENLDRSEVNVSGDTSAINAGSYQVTFSLKDPNKKWIDGTSDDKTFSWTINPQVVDPPVPTKTEFVYSGNAQTLSFSGYSSISMNTQGTYSATDAGSYEAYVYLNNTSNYVWSDGTTVAKEYAWAIQPLTVSIPVIGNTLYTYDGESHNPTFSGYSSASMNIQGTYKATNAGSYYVYVHLNSTNNYVWSDGTTEAKAYSWKINKKVLVLPIATAISFTYNGGQQSIVFTGFDSATMTKSNVHTATNAGNYTADINIKDTNNYSFPNDTYTKSYNWKINKAQGYVSVNPNSVTLSPGSMAYLDISGSSGDINDYSLKDGSDDYVKETLMNYGGLKLQIFFVPGSYQLTGSDVIIMNNPNYTTAQCTFSVRTP